MLPVEPVFKEAASEVSLDVFLTGLCKERRRVRRPVLEEVFPAIRMLAGRLGSNTRVLSKVPASEKSMKVSASAIDSGAVPLRKGGGHLAEGVAKVRQREATVVRRLCLPSAVWPAWSIHEKIPARYPLA